MPDYTERLRARRDTLVHELQRIDGLIERQEQLQADIAAVIDGLDWPELPTNDTSPAVFNGSEPAQQRGAPSADDRPKRGPNGSSPDEIVAVAKKALRDNERPMTRYELVNAVEHAGLVVGGTDKGRNMGTILWRSKQFSNSGDGYWPLGDEPPLPADYHEPDEFEL